MKFWICKMKAKWEIWLHEWEVRYLLKMFYRYWRDEYGDRIADFEELPELYAKLKYYKGFNVDWKHLGRYFPPYIVLHHMLMFRADKELKQIFSILPELLPFVLRDCVK